MVAIDVQARHIIVVKWAENLAVHRLLADQIDERNLLQPFLERFRLRLYLFGGDDRRVGDRGGLDAMTVDLGGGWLWSIGRRCSSSQVWVASPQVRPCFRSTRIGTLSRTASQPRRATSSACSRELTEQSRQSCICKSGTMPSRQQARIHSLVCRAAEPWISALSALRVSARQSGPLPNHG